MEIIVIVFYLTDGGVKCFGKNNYGELGFGNTNQVTNITDSPFTTLANSAGTLIIKMDGGSLHFAMLLENGRILTAGWDTGALGRDNDTTTPNYMNEFDGSNDSKFAVDIACTLRGTYIVTKDGKLYRWSTYIARGGNHYTW